MEIVFAKAVRADDCCVDNKIGVAEVVRLLELRPGQGNDIPNSHEFG
jgi:hypothetical protein